MHETTIREIGVKNNALWVGEPLADFRGRADRRARIYRLACRTRSSRVGKKA